MLKRVAGQSMLEYILVLTIILLALLAGSQDLKNVVKDKIFGTAKTQMEKAGDTWKNKM